MVIEVIHGDASAKLSTSLSPVVPPDAEGQACYNLHLNGNFDGISFMIKDDRITRIDINSKLMSSVGDIQIENSDMSVLNTTMLILWV